MILLRPRSGARNRPVNPIWRLSGLGIELASHIFAGMLIGWLLDRWFKTEPTLLIIFSIAGLVVGMVDFIRSALRAQAAANEQTPQSRPPAPPGDPSHDDAPPEP